MFRKVLMVALAGLLFSCGEEPASDGADGAAGADTIFLNGTIYTGLENPATVDAVAVKDGRIVFTGSEKAAREQAGGKTEIVDLGGAFMYPGFADAHGHLRGIGERELTLNLEGVASITELLKKVAERVASARPGQVISGRGWIETHWPEGRFPNRADLDAVSPDHPVILRRSDGHATVANSAALKAAGIDGATEIPFGGDILKDEEGEPTGMLIDRAQGLVAGLLTAPDREEKAEAYTVGGGVYEAYGWTGIHNMGASVDDLEIMEALSDDGGLAIRVYNSIDGNDADAVAALFESGARSSASGRIVTRAIKLYMDGALGSRGAALLAPYSDAETSGLLVAKKEDVLPILLEALRRGIQINTHAIGDRGNRLLLDWYEEAFASVPLADRAVAEPRWRDEHTQIVNPVDIPRFKALGVIPSMQASHAIGDLYFAPSRLGQERLVGAYAWRSLIDSGVIIAGGTDAPVERGDPRIEFYAAIARKDLKGFSGEGWHPEEAVSRAEALKMFTLWPAYASFMEDDLGTIEAGKLADFSVFSADFMTVPPADILGAKTVMTVVGGQIIYRAE